MGKFGKNDWKITAYKVISGIVTVGIVAAIGLQVPKVLKKIDFGAKETEATQKEEIQVDPKTMAVSGETERDQSTDSSEDASVLDSINSISASKTAKNTSEQEPAKAGLMTSEPNLNELHQMSVIAANSSSTITQQGVDNNPMMLFDGRDDTSWQEGVNGYGINENVAFSFSEPGQIKYIGFKLGNWKNDKYYFGNAIPKTMTLEFGDYSGQITFAGTREVEWVEVSPMVNADSMRITINDVYPGSKWEDTCITEIMVYAAQ